MTRNSTKIERSTEGLRCAAVSDIGMRRASNQDSLAVSLAGSTGQWRSRGHLFVVADGMGAHAAGELASKLATDTIPHSYAKHGDLPPNQALTDAVQDANRVIYAKGQDSVDFQGMGTTCSCLLLLPCGALAAHVGDSRVYRLRDHTLEQLTFDHSLVWELAAAGHTSEEDVPAYVPKNVITRSLGPNDSVIIDVEGPFSLRSGDRFLLCSDGLTGPLSNDLIGMVLATLPADEAAQTLVDLANLLGGPDNITVIVAEVKDPNRLGEVDSDEIDPNGKATDAKIPASQSSHNSKNWLGSAITAVFAFLSHRKFPKQPDGEENPVHGRHGKGPYRRYSCQPSAENIETLTDVVRQLEDLEDHREWQFDWQDIQNDRHQAYRSITKGDFDAAVVAYCRAVRCLMAALRENHTERSSDSKIDLH